MKDKLTNKQEETLQYIKKFISKNGYSPSVREICEGLGLSSPATVFVHIKKLQEKGYVKQAGSKFRTLEVLVENEYIKNNDDVISVPLLGKVTAGNPIEAIEHPDEYISLPIYMVPKGEEIFTLNVSGDSMINAGIYDGDIVILKRKKVANNGDIVVALNDQGEVTLKRFYKEKNYIRLQPENDLMNPIILNNCTILGIAIGLYRKL